MPLHCYYDEKLPNITINRRKGLMQTQHVYLNLLWNYLLHRHGNIETIRIMTNLNGVYLRMLRISHAINTEIRTRDDLSTLHEKFSKAVILDIDKE